MPDDLTERLRALRDTHFKHHDGPLPREERDTLAEAAERIKRSANRIEQLDDRIEQLEVALDRYREALRQIASASGSRSWAVPIARAALDHDDAPNPSDMTGGSDA